MATPVIGYHSGGIVSKKALEKYTRAVIDYMAPKGVNMAVMEIDNCFRFKSFPQVSDGDITAEDLRAACNEMRAAGVEPVPLYNCFGHQGWSSRNSLLRAFPEIDEAPWLDNATAFNHEWRWASMPPKDENGHSLHTYTPAWCAAEPKVFDIVFPLIDELIEASGCKTIHLGMDEVVLLGECPRCRDIPKPELFRRTLVKLHDHCAEKGVRTMIWGDRLLDAAIWHPEMVAETGKELPSDYDNLGIAACIDQIPKDVILCDWHYGHNDEHFSGELLSHGFTVFPSCWDRPENAEHLWNNAWEEAEAQDCEPRLMGMLICGWAGGEDVLRPFTDPEGPMPEELRRLPSVLDRVSEIVKKVKK